MRIYQVQLTEQEQLSLKQMATQPGYQVLFKLLQIEALNAQTALMDCKETDPDARLLALADAQAMSLIVNKLTNQLESYRAIAEPMTPKEAEEIFGDFWTMKERTH